MAQMDSNLLYKRRDDIHPCVLRLDNVDRHYF